MARVLFCTCALYWIAISNFGVLGSNWPFDSGESRDVLRRVEKEKGGEKIVIEVRNGQFMDPAAEEKLQEATSRVKRQSGAAPPGKSANISRLAWPFSLTGDSHYMAIVHWVGVGSPNIVVLTRDPTQTSTSTSDLYISTDYGYSFVKKTNLMLQPGTNKPAVLANYYPSHGDKGSDENILFMDTLHNLLYLTRNGGISFQLVTHNFTARGMTAHPTNPNIIASCAEGDALCNNLYLSESFGASWFKASDLVTNFYWGQTGYDSSLSVFIQKRESDGKFNVYLSEQLFKPNDKTRRIVATDVEDFAVSNQYMFYTKTAPGSNSNQQLFTSTYRGSFSICKFSLSLPEKFYLIADASENQVFVAVLHDLQGTAHLYISESKGVQYSLSLDNVKFFISGAPQIDLHRAGGLRGIYVCNQYTNTSKTSVRTMITFDKGGLWNVLTPPALDANRNVSSCFKGYPNCSLHLAMKSNFVSGSQYNTPILSTSTAPGSILATGNVGTVLSPGSSVNIYYSRNGGVDWTQTLTGRFYYAVSDHGGLIVAVRQFTYVDTFFYSLDEGETWHETHFSTKQVVAYGLYTEPGASKVIFTLFGSYGGGHEWLMVKLNFTSLIGRPCTSADYEKWSPSDERTSDHCLLGVKVQYQRRKPHSLCTIGENFNSQLSSFNCPCARQDYECDFGYIRSKSYTNFTCSQIAPGPITAPDVCPENTFYNISQGYRLIEGDTCVASIASEMYGKIPLPCPLKENIPFLLTAERTRVLKLSAAFPTSVPEQLVLSGLNNAISLDFHWAKKILFLTDVRHDWIKQYYLDGTGRQATLHNTTIGSPEGVAVDWISGNIYWTDTGVDYISVSRLDGTSRRVLVQDGLDEPRAIVVDPANGMMYWTDWGRTPAISSAWMDGTHVTHVVNTTIKWPNGLALDRNTSELYWTDGGFDRIEAVKIDGTGRRAVISQGLQHTFGITVYGNHIFWTDWQQRAIFSANKMTGANMRTVQSGLGGLMDIHAYYPGMQTGTNACANNNGGCSHLCLPIPPSSTGVAQRVCQCPDGLIPNATSPNSCSFDATCKSKTGYFQCQNRRCILSPEVCDHEDDCQDRSDELPAPSQSNCSLTCPRSNFRCRRSGKCIPSIYQCDHIQDCGDNSDETGCAYRQCTSFQFKCGNGKCVPNTFKCDGDDDCGDRSDEANCSSRVCPTGRFRCANSYLCIPNSWRCDGDNDCGDFSDEQSCQVPTTPPPPTASSNCSLQEYACNVTGRCIPLAWICDGFNDCPGGDDEPRSCVFNCSVNQFTCTGNGHCIPVQWQCDGDNDCRDLGPHGSNGSDEANCANHQCDPATQLRCRSGRCIPLHWHCDGDNDCGDMSDEQNCTAPTTAAPTTIPTAPTHCTTSQLYFQCTSSECIFRQQQCDGTVDCRDGSDELGCVSSTVGPSTACPPANTRCDNTSAGARCIHNSWICDHVVDCTDGSDERGCSTGSCLATQFTCNSGRCIIRRDACNGYNDCGDNSDEAFCWSTATSSVQPVTAHCPTGSYACTTGSQCYSVQHRCDGIFDCRDRSDEANCQAVTSSNATCTALQFACASGRQCISKRLVCDQIADCQDRSDEASRLCSSWTGAPTTAPSCLAPAFFQCLSVPQCISSLLQCDQKSDCTDRSDELHCNVLQALTSRSGVGVSQVNLSWPLPSAAAATSGYFIYKRNPMTNSNYTLLGYKSVPTTFYVDANVPDSTTLMYRIVAKAVGSSSSSTTSLSYVVTVTTLDPQLSPPQSAVVIRTLHQVATLSWLPPPGVLQTTQLQYQILYGPGRSCNDESLTASTPFLSYQIAGLAPNTQYSFQIRAYSARNGWGRKTHCLTFNTTHGVPKSPPVTLAATPKSPYSILLTWEAPVDVDSSTGAHHVEYVAGYTVSVHKGSTLIRKLNVTQASTVVSSLASSSTFSVVVSAYTAAGNGPAAILSVSTPPAAPSAPVGVQFNNSASFLDVWWSPSRHIDTSSAPILYTVTLQFYKSTGSILLGARNDTLSSSVNRVFRNVPGDVLVRVLVKACIKWPKGASQSCSPASTRQLYRQITVPSVSPHVDYFEVGLRELYITWDPYYGNGFVLATDVFYNLSLTTVNGGPSMKASVLANSYTFTNLDRKSQVTVTIRICTKNGCGPPSITQPITIQSTYTTPVQVKVVFASKPTSPTAFSAQFQTAVKAVTNVGISRITNINVKYIPTVTFVLRPPSPGHVSNFNALCALRQAVITSFIVDTIPAIKNSFILPHVPTPICPAITVPPSTGVTTAPTPTANPPSQGTATGPARTGATGPAPTGAPVIRTSTPVANTQSKSSLTPIIVGSVCGVVAVLVIAILVLLLRSRRLTRRLATYQSYHNRELASDVHFRANEDDNFAINVGGDDDDDKDRGRGSLVFEEDDVRLLNPED